MATHILALVCLLGGSLAQICTCPAGIITSTASCSCPTGDVLSITSTSTVGACRAFRTTTVTTTSTVGGCNCSSQTTATETAACDCPGVTSTSTIVEPTIDCPWFTATETVTQYGTSNQTLPATTGAAASTGILAIGTAPAKSTCSLSSLPDNFYMRSQPSEDYLLIDPYCGKLITCPNKADATVFHTNETDPYDLDGVPQLSLHYPAQDVADDEEYGAYVQYEGGPIQFFQAGQVPEAADEDGNGDWFIVTASFSTLLCQLSLIPFGLHDLSTPENCGGYLSLGYGIGEEECPEVALTVEEA